MCMHELALLKLGRGALQYSLYVVDYILLI